MIEFSPEGL